LGLNDNDWPERPDRDPEAYTEEEIEKLLETAAGTFRELERKDVRAKEDHNLKTRGSKRDVPVGEWLTAKVMAQKKAYARPDVKRSRRSVVRLWWLRPRTLA